MAGLYDNIYISLDRDWWSYSRCEECKRRKSQLSVDETPHDKRGGVFHHFCWQCYWAFDKWKLGPIINCGPAWDEIDERRKYFDATQQSTPS